MKLFTRVESSPNLQIEQAYSPSAAATNKQFCTFFNCYNTLEVTITIIVSKITSHCMGKRTNDFQKFQNH